MLGRFLRVVVGDAVVQMAVGVLACWGAYRLLEAVSFGPAAAAAVQAEWDELESTPPPAVQANFEPPLLAPSVRMMARVEP